MIAIPVESNKSQPVTTKLFGNASFFALVDPKTKTYEVVENTACGNGIATANFLLENKVESAFYGFLGDGPFHVLIRNGVQVYWMGKETMSLEDAINGAETSAFTEVTVQNAASYLDPGTTEGSCQCGCSHD